MMPERHSQQDAAWIREQLERLPARLRVVAIEGYSDAYRTAYEDEPADHKKENRARLAANSRLRQYVDKIMLACV
jgi:hypothetical protein